MFKVPDSKSKFPHLKFKAQGPPNLRSGKSVDTQKLGEDASFKIA